MLRTSFAALSLIAICITVPAQEPTARNPQGGAGGQVTKPNDPTQVMPPTDSFLVVSVKASRLWDNAAAKPLRDWVASQKQGIPLDSVIGVPLAELDRITWFIPTFPGLLGEQTQFMILTTRQPYNEATVLKSLGVEKRGRFGGRVILINSEFSRLAFLDDRTFLLFSDSRSSDTNWENLVVQLLFRKTDGPLAAALNAAKDHDFTVGIDIKQLSLLFEGATPEFVLKEYVQYQTLFKARSATLTADFDQDAKCSLTLSFADSDTAKRAGPVLDEAIKDLAKLFAKPLDKTHTKANDALTERLMPWFLAVLKQAKVTVEGKNVQATSVVPYQDELSKVAAALPNSVSASRHTRQALNNLKQLLLACHNFADVYGFMPSDVLKTGNLTTAMSWRIQILPFIEQLNLYGMLDHTRSWDDPVNLKVLEAAEMPKVYQIPGRDAPKGHTYFRILTMPKNAKGNERPLLKEGEIGPTFAQITDGTSNTFMIVEAEEAVPWYKPDLLAYDGKLPLPQLGDKKSDLFLAGFCDGHVESLRPSKLGEKNIRAYITINGGEVIDVKQK
jgi:hypothetical protein